MIIGEKASINRDQIESTEVEQNTDGKMKGYNYLNPNSGNKKDVVVQYGNIKDKLSPAKEEDPSNPSVPMQEKELQKNKPNFMFKSKYAKNR